jgi:hypothetical protein
MPPKKAPTRDLKQEHIVLTLKQKMKIYKRLEKGENCNVHMQEFNVGSSMTCDISGNWKA